MLDPQLSRIEGLLQISNHERQWRLSYDNDTGILLVSAVDIEQYDPFMLTSKNVITYRVNGLK